MDLKTRPAGKLRGAIVGAALTVVFGLGLWWLRVGDPMSYDFPFVFVSQAVTNDVIIVKMDEASHVVLKQSAGLWNRQLHAQLLDKLKRDRSAMAVFDVLFVDAGSEQENEKLTRAIKDHGNVVLIGEVEDFQQPGYSATLLRPPKLEFSTVARGWGSAEVWRDDDLVVRRYHPSSDQFPTLPWRVAVLAGAPVQDSIAEQMKERGLRYYGPKETVPTVGYSSALEMPDGYFTGKIVFIGGKPPIGGPTEQGDLFRTPYTRWSGVLTSGIEIHATTFLNLMRGDWLARLPARWEILLILAAGLLFGFGLNLVRPLVGAGLAVLGMLAVTAFALWLFWQRNTWFSWMVIAGFQIPGAWICSVVSHSMRTDREKEELREKLSTRLASPRLPEPIFLEPQIPAAQCSDVVPDHELVRCIGKGAYGEVWLAKNAIGTYHAVKIIHRHDFASMDSYAREFKGIQKYMPISRNHPGLVQILHIGRNDPAGYYYCIMECGDDEIAGPIVNPETYSPRNLAKDLHKRGRIPVNECVSMTLVLAEALDFLHRQGLIHRDIKPSNIIFVNRVPKLADIGLVTDIVSPGEEISGVGTVGYLAPEGPGNPTADIYSLGKVIYEASMGRDREQFPELPTSLADRTDSAALLRLNKIILKACDEDVALRYQTASELRADLLALQRDFVAPQER